MQRALTVSHICWEPVKPGNPDYVTNKPMRSFSVTYAPNCVSVTLNAAVPCHRNRMCATANLQQGSINEVLGAMGNRHPLRPRQFQERFSKTQKNFPEITACPVLASESGGGNRPCRTQRSRRARPWTPRKPRES